MKHYLRLLSASVVLSLVAIVTTSCGEERPQVTKAAPAPATLPTAPQVLSAPPPLANAEPQRAAQTLVVDPMGNDASNGSAAAPFKTMQKAADAAMAGDTVQVRPGTYEERVTTKNHGTADKPVRFVGGAGVLVRSVAIKSNFTHLTGFEFSYDVPGYSAKVKFNYKAGTANPNWAFIELDNVEGCQVVGNMVRAGRKYLSGVMCLGQTKNCLIKNNTLIKVNYFPIKLDGEGVIVEGNTIEDTIWDGILLAGRKHIIRNNTFTLVNQGGVGYPSVFLARHLLDEQVCEDILIEGNYAKTSHAKAFRFISPRTKGITVRNNVFEGITCAGVIGVPDVAVVGNVFMSSSRDHDHAVVVNEGGSNAAVTGNVFYACGITATSTTHGWYAANENATGFSATGNRVSGPFPEFAAKSGFNEAGGVNGGNPFASLKGTYHAAWKVPAFTVEAPLMMSEMKAPPRTTPDLAKLAKGAKAKAAGGEIELVEAVNPDIITSRFAKRFVYDRLDNPKLKALRETYQLDEVVKDGKDEFAKMCLLMTWVRGRFRFDHPSIVTDNAQEIIAEGAKGGRFFCLQYSDVMLGCANSLGWTARLADIRLREPGTEHTITDVWSNQYRKWVLMDATIDGYYERQDAEGIPLTTYEIRSERIKSEVKNLQQVLGAKRERKKDIGIVAASKYAFIMYIGNNNLQDAHKDYGDNAFMILDDWNKGIPWHRRDSPSDPQEMYWSLGEAKMALYDGGPGTLEVEFTTQTPDFATYLVKINDGEWQPCGAVYKWQLQKGVNRITATTRNIRDVTGPENHIVISY